MVIFNWFIPCAVEVLLQIWPVREHQNINNRLYNRTYIRRSLPKVFAHRLYSAGRIKFANASPFTQVYYHKSSYFYHLLPLNILWFNMTLLSGLLPLPLKYMARQMRRLSAKLESKPELLTISSRKPNNVALILLLTKSFVTSTLSTVPDPAVLLSK